MIGTTVGHYEVLETLGSGGMGIVYGARDMRLGRTVALKMIPERLAADPAHLKRFEREARVLAALNHPNIATIYGIEQAPNGAPFLVLERVEGETLEDRVKHDPLPLSETLRIGRAISLALEAAHARGIVHRDLKPRNVMVGSAGGVKVLDFGIARQIPQSTAKPGDATLPDAVTETGTVVGTPAHMSPEQIRGETEDARSDVFAFGSLLYELAVGKPAFRGATVPDILASVLRGEPDWSALPSDTPIRFRDLIRSCLVKDPDLRLPTMGSARDEIEAVLAARVRPTLADEARGAKHNLPAELTSFIGRERETADCIRHLAEARLVTLTGVGGSGKSRLMLHVAEKSLETFPGGVWFVDLAPFSNPTRASAILASALGLREAPGQPIAATVAAHLCAQKALVLFDNCEHMLDAMGALIAELLKECPRLRVVATSREPLKVDGERVVPVAPMPLPDVRSGRDPKRAEASDAVHLFLDRALVARPSFHLDSSNVSAVVEICRRLDGIPLALELAAARLKVLTVEDVRARLDQRFRLLTGGARSGLSRHQTLQATIQWSYDQLTQDEQRLFRGMAVFAGGWTLDDAVSTASSAMGAEDEFETLDRLTTLAEKSLILVEWTADNEARYHMLETLHHYALERLDESGEASAWRDAHFSAMLGLVTRAEPELVGPRQEAWFRKLEGEHENILAALAWCDRAEDGPAACLRMSGVLWRFWWYGGHFSLGLATLEAALARDLEAKPTPERAQALYGAAQMERELGRYDRARGRFLESLAVAEGLDDPVRIARAYNGLGNTAEYAGDYESAREYHGKALELSRRLGNERGIAIDLHNLAIVLLIQKDFDAARPLFQESLAIFRKAGDVNGAQSAVTNLAMVATGLGRFDEAKRCFAESFRLAEELPSGILTADSIESFAGLAVKAGAASLAGTILGASDEIRSATGYSRSVEGRREFEEMTQRIRAILGPERQQELERAGRALTFDQAVRLVRDWLEESNAP